MRAAAPFAVAFAIAVLAVPAAVLAQGYPGQPPGYGPPPGQPPGYGQPPPGMPPVQPTPWGMPGWGQPAPPATWGTPPGGGWGAPPPAPRPPGPKPFGAEGGQLVLSAERMFGIARWAASVDAGPKYGGEQTSRGTDFSVLWSPVTSGGFSPYSMPRLGVDVSVVPSVTVGAALGYASGSAETEAGGKTSDLGTRKVFAVAPRLGWALGLNDMVALWIRAGVTYFSVSSSSPADETIVRGFSVGTDPQLVLAPVPHFAFTVGPMVDIGLGGTGQTTTKTGALANQQRDFDARTTSFGLSAGLLGYF